MRAGQVRSGQVRAGKARSGQGRSGQQVRSSQVRSGQVRASQVRSGQGRAGGQVWYLSLAAQAQRGCLPPSPRRVAPLPAAIRAPAKGLCRRRAPCTGKRREDKGRQEKTRDERRREEKRREEKRREGRHPKGDRGYEIYANDDKHIFISKNIRKMQVRVEMKELTIYTLIDKIN